MTEALERTEAQARARKLALMRKIKTLRQKISTEHKFLTRATDRRSAAFAQNQIDVLKHELDLAKEDLSKLNKTHYIRLTTKDLKNIGLPKKKTPKKVEDWLSPVLQKMPLGKSA